MAFESNVLTDFFFNRKSEILEITSQTKKLKSDFEEKVTRLENENEVKSEEIKKLELEKLSDKNNIQKIQSENNELKNQLEQLNKQINTIKVKNSQMPLRNLYYFWSERCFLVALSNYSERKRNKIERNKRKLFERKTKS